jgi:hypothetical protein
MLDEIKPIEVSNTLLEENLERINEDKNKEVSLFVFDD